MKKSATTKGESPSRLIDARIKELDDWRGKTLSHVRALIKQAEPEVVEEWKWRGVPVWSHDGIICTGETYKSVVKLTFAKGASLKDPSGLFNSSLEGNTRRAIDIHEDDEIDEDAFKTLIRAAAALNRSSPIVESGASRVSCLPPRGIFESKPGSRVNHFENSAYAPRSSIALKSARARCASNRAVSDASPRPK